MFINILLVVAILAAVATAHVHDLSRLETFSFEDFVEKYNHKYLQGSEEWRTRKAAFEKEIARVRAHNARGLGWKETINHFSAMSKEEKKKFYGRNKSVKHTHGLLGAAPQRDQKNDKDVSDLPKNVDWRKAGIVSAVKDQGHCGSCWAFASTAVVESAVAKASGMLFDLSVQQMAMCAPNPDHCGGTGNCAGSTAELAFDYVAKSTGMVEEFMYGYGAYYGNVTSCEVPEGPPKATIGGYEQIPTNELKPFMNALNTEGPIAISVDASTWHAYHSGIYDGCDASQPDIDHAVVAVGYGEDKDGKFWLVRNSWSASWGEAGYIRLHRGGDETKCGMDTTPQDGVACEGDTEPLKTCGTCGILFDNAYPTGAKAVDA